MDLALLKGDLELAKINAEMPENDLSLKKKLWLKIAKYVVEEKQDLKTCVIYYCSFSVYHVHLSLCQGNAIPGRHNPIKDRRHSSVLS